MAADHAVIDLDRPGRWDFLVKWLFAAFAAVIFGIAVGTLIVVLQISAAILQFQDEAERLSSEVYYQNISLLQTQAAARDTLAELRGIRGDLQITQLQMARIVDNQLSAANGTLYRTGYSLSVAAGSLAASADQVAAPAAQVESQLSDHLNNLSLFTDCDHNADCAFNRYVGAVRGIEKAANAWGDAAPRQSEAASAALQNTEKITADFSRKPPVWARIAKWAWWLRPWR